ncbi:MAG: transferase [Moorea sp. SIO2C4]|nr:transferase [Moorena sp. SIO3A2]NES43290.1 transferase [Moorena sp. SIO2C4]
MHLPKLLLSNNSHIHVEGNVSIDPSAAISAGVILRADPDSKITIAAGVCIGMGAIIHAHKGTVEVESGASLGAGVLVVGKGKIGANASIGSLTTIWNHSVESLQVVPSASVLGDKGRPLPEESQPTPDSLEQKPQESSSTLPDQSFTTESVNGQVPSTSNTVATDTTETNTTDTNSIETNSTETNSTETNSIDTNSTETNTTETIEAERTAESQTESPAPKTQPTVHGQGSLNRLLDTLFPYNQSFNSPSKDT